MKISELRALTLREIAAKIRNGGTSSTELVGLLLDQVKRTDHKLKAYVTVCGDSALELARAAELQLKSGDDLGPLHGIPVSIKDLFETAGVNTTCGSKILQDYVPKKDCAVVARLKRAGAIVFGKLNTHEFALGYVTQPTRNPWNLNCIPGGSSGGSGAAIAACSALTSTGSDTMGSIRIPASFCGVVGLKPTYGRVSRTGVFPESWSLDHVGPITRRVEDAAFMLSVMAGHDPSDPSSSLEPVPDYISQMNHCDDLTVGVPKNYFFEYCDKEVERAVRAGIDKLRELGLEVIEFEFPMTRAIEAAYTAIDFCESSAFHERNLAERPGDYSSYVRKHLEEGMFIPATYYIRALRTRALILPEVLKTFKNCDAIVTPTEPMVAPEIRVGEYGDTIENTICRYVAPFNLTGLPAVSVPCGFSSSGLPIGMQIVGNLYDESTMLQIANAYEKSTTWHLKTPELN